MKGLITHRVTIGDSLQKLARMYNIDDWRLIAEINELEEPYINSVLEDKSFRENKYVANVGDIILIPSQQAYKVASREKQEEIEAEAYGRDLDLYHGVAAQDTVKGYVTYGKDVDTVEGIPNLAQQLMSRLSVNKGSLLLHKEFGSNLYKYLGKLHSQENINKIRWEVESCLRSDYRVSDVKDLKAQVIDNNVYITAKVIPITPGKPFEFKYTLKK